MRPLATLTGLVLVVAACGSGSETDAAVIDPGDGGRYSPTIDPANFVEAVDHPYLPLRPGSRWVYEGDGERVEVTVLGERRVVMGLTATVVRDVVSEDGEVVEDTLDWFAQDEDGNVWYLGEESKDVEGGKVISTEGSWEAGVDGALPGIVMPARPVVGRTYRQEYDKGEAEDLGEILRLDATAEVRFRTFTDVLVTKDWNPLEPETVEQKYYAKGVGLVLETVVKGGKGRIELIEHTTEES